MKGIYKGYLMAILIGVLNLNFYSAFRDIWSEYKLLSQDDDITKLLASKESIGAILALLLVHPLDTIK